MKSINELLEAVREERVDLWKGDGPNSSLYSSKDMQNAAQYGHRSACDRLIPALKAAIEGLDADNKALDKVRALLEGKSE